ncbi:MAG TPA: cyclodeaminase/cyclohydrolase family protein [Sedimentibacter sp.]|jgi:formiminotetrahydrofolate cyclodeaminase|nr:cyclodeaminase/cyclohydrolase family protein [Sedimentibacter sp.]NLA12897.1 cyclodeaminase/cyclohydrolase family protein [Tissierellia bacterium]HOA19261.1 cyclodeaminase/cyclohydrolase family protein [Sedimentibacter sp.]HOG62881.1 cyclodeaminase/cyclohydrolase family protein [Sedimentibacter sp.]HOT21024.1 cyclodeaminase/cyclohydrolase family protein [Sedimentibacter sp.]
MKNLTINEFAKIVASDSPVPGGGSIAALCGALSAALSEMVANLTVTKKKYADSKEEMNAIINKASQLRDRLLNYIEEDSLAYKKVMEAYKLPKETEEEKCLRLERIQEGLKVAASVPLEVAETSYEIFPLVEAVVLRGNSSSVTDALVGAMMARTGVLSAILNIRINLDSIKDEDFVKVLKEKADILEGKTRQYEKKILELAPFK